MGKRKTTPKTLQVLSDTIAKYLCNFSAIIFSPDMVSRQFASKETFHERPIRHDRNIMSLAPRESLLFDLSQAYAGAFRMEEYEATLASAEACSGEMRPTAIDDWRISWMK